MYTLISYRIHKIPYQLFGGSITLRYGTIYIIFEKMYTQISYSIHKIPYQLFGGSVLRYVLFRYTPRVIQKQHVASSYLALKSEMCYSFIIPSKD